MDGLQTAARVWAYVYWHIPLVGMHSKPDELSLQSQQKRLFSCLANVLSITILLDNATICAAAVSSSSPSLQQP